MNTNSIKSPNKYLLGNTRGRTRVSICWKLYVTYDQLTTASLTVYHYKLQRSLKFWNGCFLNSPIEHYSTPYLRGYGSLKTPGFVFEKFPE